tara:strand:+ start:36 stop:203 length:168 start_codon:yes stop_codon:yes gene_type:complete
MNNEEKKHLELPRALCKDDFANDDAWEHVCHMFNVPIGAYQIYFNATNIRYGEDT